MVLVNKAKRFLLISISHCTLTFLQYPPIAKINPNQTEICNGIDDDCDGVKDEGVQTTYYPDVDRDGYGDASKGLDSCIKPENYTLDKTDCNDLNGEYSLFVCVVVVVYSIFQGAYNHIDMFSTLTCPLRSMISIRNVP